MKLTDEWSTERWIWGGEPDAAGQARDGYYAHAFYVPGFGWFGGFPSEVAQRIVEAHNLRSERKEMINRFGLGEVWFWQSDGGNFPESLSCPVLIQADDLRALLAKAATA